MQLKDKCIAFWIWCHRPSFIGRWRIVFNNLAWMLHRVDVFRPNTPLLRPVWSVSIILDKPPFELHNMLHKVWSAHSRSLFELRMPTLIVMPTLGIFFRIPHAYVKCEVHIRTSPGHLGREWGGASPLCLAPMWRAQYRETFSNSSWINHKQISYLT